MGGGLVEPDGQRPAHVKLVGSPVRRERGVEAVRHEFRCAGALRTFYRLIRELDGAPGLAGVRPAAGECSGEARPCCIVGRTGQYVVQLGWQLSGLGPEQVDRGRSEHRLGPRIEIAALSPAAGGRLVIQACRGLSLAGRAGGVGAAEEITDRGRVHDHTSS